MVTVSAMAFDSIQFRKCQASLHLQLCRGVFDVFSPSWNHQVGRLYCGQAKFLARMHQTARLGNARITVHSMIVNLHEFVFLLEQWADLSSHGEKMGTKLLCLSRCDPKFILTNRHKMDTLVGRGMLCPRNTVLTFFRSSDLAKIKTHTDTTRHIHCW